MNLISSTKFKTLFFFALLFLLTACSMDPFVEDWHRDRISTYSDGPPQINICFNNYRHSKQQVEKVALEECKIRIEEIQNIGQVLELQKAQNQKFAEGSAFKGPIKRQKDIQAQISTLKLVYAMNDKWYCPLTIPNRVSFLCKYDPKATDSSLLRKNVIPVTPAVDLPPELPDDLKPQ